MCLILGADTSPQSNRRRASPQRFETLYENAAIVSRASRLRCRPPDNVNPSEACDLLHFLMKRIILQVKWGSLILHSLFEATVGRYRWQCE